MATGLDVWIAAPGSACAVADGAWTVTVYDAHGTVFSWAGDTYQDLDAPFAHWAGAIPPGTYVVRATRKDGTLTTDHAIAAVDCDRPACVRLYVAGEDGETPPPECRVQISSVTPRAREKRVVNVTVAGDAAGCDAVEVTVECDETGQATTTAQVAGGEWQATLDVHNLGCRCGGQVRVTARCTENGDCADVKETTLDCDDDGGDEPRPSSLG